MATAATQSKPRAPKAIAVSKLIGGKLVTTLAKSELDKLSKARELVRSLWEITDWKPELEAADKALYALINKVSAPAT